MSYYLTKAGLTNLQAELEEITQTKLPQILQSINQALTDGDIRESSALDSARLEKEKIEQRKAEITDILANYEIIEEDAQSSDGQATVQLGKYVKISYTDILEDYAIKGKISNESPLAQKILGKKIGEIVELEVEDSVFKIKILEIK
jgi:transcription elongation factor GreA